MDRIDKELVRLLQENARTPLKVLAAKVYLSSPAVSSRIERLERDGVLKGYHAEVDRLKLGYHITAYINLAMEPVQKTEFYPFIKSCENVLECSCVTGEFSMILKVAFQSTVELDVFIGQLQRYGKTKTQIVFSTAVERKVIPSTEL